MTQSNESKFFDLHTTGIGYLNRIREVTVRKGPGFLACTVAALHGSVSVQPSHLPKLYHMVHG